MDTDQQFPFLSAFGWNYAAMQLTGGMFNFIGNLSSIATPIVIGMLVTKTDFGPAFVYMTVVAAAGILSYVLLVGKVKRVEG